jgi:hypothetical protein
LWRYKAILLPLNLTRLSRDAIASREADGVVVSATSSSFEMDEYRACTSILIPTIQARMRRGFDGVRTVSGESDDHPSGGFLSIGKGSAGPWHLEPISVDFEALDFRIERSLRAARVSWRRRMGPRPVHNTPHGAVSMISFSCRARTRLSVLTRLRACPNARGSGNLEKCIKVNWLTQ